MTSLALAVAAKNCSDPRKFMDFIGCDEFTVANDVTVYIAHDHVFPSETVSRDFPNVNVYSCPADMSVLGLWGTAISHSHGDYVAILDIHCPPSPGWLSVVIDQIKKGAPLFYGSVEPGWGSREAGIIGYLVEYAQFMDPLPKTAGEVPGNNLVLRRDLLPINEELESKGFFKTFLLWKLRGQSGLVPLPVEGMAVVYRKPYQLGQYVRKRYLHGCCFGATRHDNAGQPPYLACLFFSPLLPLIRIRRIWSVSRANGQLRLAFIHFSFQIFLSELFWSLGEFSGYLFRSRNCCRKLE